jgi:hypothetical protein
MLVSGLPASRSPVAAMAVIRHARHIRELICTFHKPTAAASPQSPSGRKLDAWKLCGLVVLLALFSLDSAWALKATRGQVKSACSKAGGTFHNHPDGLGYGCTRTNCDGKGGTCDVACKNNGNCHGYTPSRARSGGGVNGILGVAGSTQTKQPAGKGTQNPPGGVRATTAAPPMLKSRPFVRTPTRPEPPKGGAAKSGRERR